MLKYTFAALALLALAFPAAVAAAETPKQHCERVIADGNKGPKQAYAAAEVYRFGKWQGQKCTKVDYFQAFEFYAKAGAGREIDKMLKELDFKVNAGQVSATRAMERLRAKGYIRVEKVRAE